MDKVFKRLGNYPIYEINRSGIVRKIKNKSVEFIDGNPANCDVENLRWVK